MTFDLINYCQDRNIQYWTHGKNVSQGSVNIRCPFCSDKSNHLGFLGRTFNCWDCGHHSIFEVIKELEQKSNREVFQILKQYQDNESIEINQIVKHPVLKLPEGIDKQFNERASKYLESRNYCPETLITRFKLMSTGPIGNYKFRIIIPVFKQGQMVSYTGRDYTGKAELRYKNCNKKDEIISIKHCLGGLEYCWNDYIFIVEGSFDMFRFGSDSACTYGIEWSEQQAVQIAKGFKKAFICYDNEPNAQKQAKSLVNYINMFKKCHASIVNIDKKDPSEMSSEEIIKLKNSLR